MGVALFLNSHVNHFILNKWLPKVYILSETLRKQNLFVFIRNKHLMYIKLYKNFPLQANHAESRDSKFL